MVSKSKKKNRGKQRKQKQADAKDRDNRTVVVVDDDPRFKSFAKDVVSQPPAKVVEAVQLGMLPQTAGAAHVNDFVCLRRLVEAGLLDVVLGFFRECENVSIDTMLPFENVQRGSELVASPMQWLLLCIRISSIPELKDLRMTIANGIQPLFKCLRDDHKRKLFKSRKDWLEGTSTVLILLNHLLMSKDEAIETCIFNHEGVSELLIRSFFWKSHRPDIMDELKELEQASSLPPGSRVPNTELILQLINVYASRKEEMKLNHGERKDKLYDMAATSIVNKRHDKQCNTNFIVGLLQRLKTDDEFKSGSIRHRSNLLLWHLVAAGSVDKEVIKEVCDVGSNYVFNKGDAGFQTTMCFVMLNPADGESGVRPNVNHYAYAISVGCFEMLIDLLLKYSWDGSDGSEHMIANMESIFDNASSIMSERKVARAMLDRREKINESLVPLERKINQGNGRSVILMRIVRGIRSMVDGRTDVDLPFNYAKGYACQTCHAMLDDKTLRRCGKCKSAVYCSRECQVKDWQSHRSACNSFSKGNNKKWKDVERQQENISDAFLKLFMNNIANLLMQAIVMDWNILDCTVLADTKKALPSIRLVPSNMITWHNSVENKAYRQTVKQFHLAGNLVGLIRTSGQIHTVGLPPAVLGEKTWKQAQAELKSSITDNNLVLIKTICPETRKKMCGQMFCDWYDEYKATTAVDRVVL